MKIKDQKDLKHFKVVLMGESGVGKTSIINRYIKDTFDEKLMSTVGVCFNSKIILIPELNESCKLDVI